MGRTGTPGWIAVFQVEGDDAPRGGRQGPPARIGPRTMQYPHTSEQVGNVKHRKLLSAGRRVAVPATRASDYDGEVPTNLPNHNREETYNVKDYLVTCCQGCPGRRRALPVPILAQVAARKVASGQGEMKRLTMPGFKGLAGPWGGNPLPSALPGPLHIWKKGLILLSP